MLVDGATVIEELDYVHLFDYGVADTYRLEYALQQPVSNLRITNATQNSLTVAWDSAAGATASYIVIKPDELGDQYYRVAKEFTQVETFTIRNLISATAYAIKVYTGSQGNYERTGALVVGSTIGNATCGNSEVDTGEDCDDGVLNGQTNCTSACITRLPSDYR